MGCYVESTDRGVVPSFVTAGRGAVSVEFWTEGNARARWMPVRHSPVGEAVRWMSKVVGMVAPVVVVWHRPFFGQRSGDYCSTTLCEADAPNSIGEMLDLFVSERPAEDLSLPVGQPLEDLVAAKLVVPDRGGNVTPVGAVVRGCRRWSGRRWIGPRTFRSR